MSDKLYVGLDVTGFENNGLNKPISRVTLVVDDETSFTSGDDTGIEISADCPHATQEMVDALFAQLKGYRYQAYSADDAGIDPAMELGDGVTVNGVYSTVSRITDDGSGFYGISAPGDEELEDEYPTTGPMTQAFNRKISQTKSLISKTAEEIRLEISNTIDDQTAAIDLKLGEISGTITDVDGRVTRLSETLDGIEGRVEGVEGDYSTLSQSVSDISAQISGADGSISARLSVLEGFTVTDDEGTVKIKGGSVTANGLHVNAANIDGKLSASQINTSELVVGDNITMGSNAKISWSQVTNQPTIPTETNQLTNNSGYITSSAISSFVTESQVTEITENTVTAAYINGLDITAKNLKGAYIGILDSSGSSVASIQVEKTTTTGLTISSGYSFRAVADGNVFLQAWEGSTSTSSLTMERNYNSSTGGYSAYIRVMCNLLYPDSSYTAYLGGDAGMWQAVYAKTGTIQTSDRNQKHDIEALPDKYVDLLMALDPVRYKMNDGTSGRYHVGYIAQEVEDAMEANGIDSQEFGGFVKGQNDDGDDTYYLRYEEFMAIHTKALQNINKRLEAAGL